MNEGNRIRRKDKKRNEKIDREHNKGEKIKNIVLEQKQELKKINEKKQNTKQNKNSEKKMGKSPDQTHPQKKTQRVLISVPYPRPYAL